MKFSFYNDRSFIIVGCGAVISAIGLALLESEFRFLFIILIIMLGFKTNKTIVIILGFAFGLLLAYLYAKSPINFITYLLTSLLFSLWIGYGFEKLRLLIQTDDLTGVFNRRYFFQRLEAELNRSYRYGQIFSLVIIDLDDFKMINDTYGHVVGDQVLQDVSHIFKKGIRSCDTIGRLGGEEFGVILPNTRTANVITMIKRLQREIRGSRSSQEGIKLSFSAGIAEFSPDISAKELYNQADQALYGAKKKKNDVHVYH